MVGHCATSVTAPHWTVSEIVPAATRSASIASRPARRALAQQRQRRRRQRSRAAGELVAKLRRARAADGSAPCQSSHVVSSKVAWAASSPQRIAGDDQLAALAVDIAERASPRPRRRRDRCCRAPCRSTVRTMYDRVNVDSINQYEQQQPAARRHGSAAGRRRAALSASAARRSMPTSAAAASARRRRPADARAAATRATTSSGCAGAPRSGASRTRRRPGRCNGGCRFSNRRSP